VIFRKSWNVALMGVFLVLMIAGMAWGQIDWNAPKPWTERLLGDKYILPEGWKEAVKGVEKIVFINSGSLAGDIATCMNMLRFEELTGIKVEAIPATPGEALSKGLTVLTTGDTSVHAVLANNPTFDLATLAATGKLSPVDDFWPEEVKSLYNPNMANYLGWDGHYYLLPMTYIGHPIFYRKSWLEEIGAGLPSSFAELVEICEKLRGTKPEGYYPLIFTGTNPDIFETFLPLVYSQGKLLFENGKYQFDSPEAKNALSWLVEIIKRKLAPPESITWNFAGAGDFFATGKAGFVLGLSSGTAYGFKTSPEVGTDFGAIAPPKWAPETSDEHAGKGTVGCNSMVINSAIADNYKAAVMLFGDYLRSLEAQRNELFVEGNDSGLLYLWENAEEEIKKVDWNLAKRAAEELGITAPTPVNSTADIPGFEGRREAALKAAFEIYPPGFNEIADVFVEVLAQAVQGEITVDEALSMVQEKADETLQ